MQLLLGFSVHITFFLYLSVKLAFCYHWIWLKIPFVLVSWKFASFYLKLKIISVRELDEFSRVCIFPYTFWTPRLFQSMYEKKTGRENIYRNISSFTVAQKLSIYLINIVSQQKKFLRVSFFILWNTLNLLLFKLCLNYWSETLWVMKISHFHKLKYLLQLFRSQWTHIKTKYIKH